MAPGLLFNPDPGPTCLGKLVPSTVFGTSNILITYRHVLLKKMCTFFQRERVITKLYNKIASLLQAKYSNLLNSCSIIIFSLNVIVEMIVQRSYPLMNKKFKDTSTNFQGLYLVKK